MKIKQINATYIKCFIGLFALLFVKGISYAKTPSFDDVFIYVATDLTYSNPERALKIADSLFRHSTHKKQELTSLMLTANIYYRISDLKQAFHYSRQAEKMAKELKDYDWMIRIQGFYSSIYRDINFFEEGLKHLEIVDRLSPKLKDEKKRLLVEILNAQSKAYFLLDQNMDPDKILHILDKTEKLYPQLEELSVGGYHIAANEELRGRMFLRKEECSKGLAAYKKALTYLDTYTTANYPIYGYTYVGIASIKLKENNLEEAKYYFDLASKIVLDNNVPDLNIFYNNRILAYYEVLGDWESYREAEHNLNKLIVDLTNKKNEMLSNLFGEVRQEKDHYLSKLNKFRFWTILIVVSLVIFLFYLRNRGKQRAKYVQTILDQLGASKLKKEMEEQDKEISLSTKQVKKIYELTIAPDTLERILKDLEDFESKALFLNPTVDSSTLANYCQTNVRYISEIINTYKNEGVNAYINRLRITYILEKLKEDPEYRTYKISYLADEAGFSSHSKFSAEFKRIIGLSPSIFISKLPKIS